MSDTAGAVGFSISVVIPCLNRVIELQRALKSIYQQTKQPDQIIVVDDGSEQPLEPQISPFFPKVEWLTQENRGVSSARNFGIQNASGDWIALLDSDDEWTPEKLESHIWIHQQKPDLLASHTNEIWIRNGNQVVPPKYLDKSNHELFQRSLTRCLICPSSAFIHRSIFRKIGSFDETLTACEDYDFWLRLLAEEEKIELIDKKLTIKHGGHSDQLSATTWGMDRFRIKSLEKLLDHSKLSVHQTQAILETLVKKSGILIQGSIKRGRNDQVLEYKKKKAIFHKMIEAEFAKSSS
ncbi:MAG: glycosyl transferase [Opitutae bacterium]|nr:glycosyl transferase [Opitutae bacterium]|tara:strand:+ start:15982 stop:16866 length:885 start_codon:yes stop_codon:yes gene_type:complete